jgi:hypothetical protein
MLLTEQNSAPATPPDTQQRYGPVSCNNLNWTAISFSARQNNESSMIGGGGLPSERGSTLPDSRHREDVGFKRSRDLEGAGTIKSYGQREPCTSTQHTVLDPDKHASSGSDLSQTWMGTNAAATAWSCSVLNPPTKSPSFTPGPFTLPPMQLPPVPLQLAANASQPAADYRTVQITSQPGWALCTEYGGGTASSLLLPNLPSLMSGYDPARSLPSGAGELCWGGWMPCLDSIRGGGWDDRSFQADCGGFGGRGNLSSKLGDGLNGVLLPTSEGAPSSLLCASTAITSQPSTCPSSLVGSMPRTAASSTAQRLPSALPDNPSGNIPGLNAAVVLPPTPDPLEGSLVCQSELGLLSWQSRPMPEAQPDPSTLRRPMRTCEPPRLPPQP